LLSAGIIAAAQAGTHLLYVRRDMHL